MYGAWSIHPATIPIQYRRYLEGVKKSVGSGIKESLGCNMPERQLHPLSRSLTPVVSGIIDAPASGKSLQAGGLPWSERLLTDHLQDLGVNFEGDPYM